MNNNIAIVAFDDKSKKEYLINNFDIKIDDFVKVSDSTNLGIVVELLNRSITEEDQLPSIVEIVLENNKAAVYELNSIKLNVKILNEFAYADYHTDMLMKIKDKSYRTSFSFIKSIKVVNTTSSILTNCYVKTSFASNIFNLSNILIDQIASDEQVTLRIPYLDVDKFKLEELIECEPSSVRFELFSSDNELLAFQEIPFLILPICQPSRILFNDIRLYSKFISPNTNIVKQIGLNAVKYNDGRALYAYLNTDIVSIINEAKAIFLALQEWNIVYQNPPIDTIDVQRIRMPEEVLNTHIGTCLDTSILYCACLEEIGIHPILVIVDRHAFAGFFLNSKDKFNDMQEIKPGVIYNLVTSNKICLVETTLLTHNSSSTFQDAIDLGLNNVSNFKGNVFSAIDVCNAHLGIFSPIQPKNILDEELKVINKTVDENQKINAISEIKYLNVLRDKEKDRFTIWERKLLDLTEANPLVNFKMRILNCIRIVTLEKIGEFLANNDNVNLTFNTIPNLKDLSTNSFEFNKSYNSLLTSTDHNKLIGIGNENTLRNLIKKSNSAMEETGAATLYLCLGVLTYRRKASKELGTAPFMVLPIKIINNRLSLQYNILYDYDDIMINQTFFEYYKQEHSEFDFEQLYNISSNDNYLDIVYTFKNNIRADIQLDENIFFIANLTFSHYIMWNDIRKRKKELQKNDVINSFLSNQSVLKNKIDENYFIEEKEIYQDFAAPLSFDSTQLKAILECAAGKSFILDGPPGTGKSQTIVNMIVNAIYHGKTVLFVAEKKAALDVVADRLKKLGDMNSDNNLGRFCLELHSNKANKTAFFEKLKSSMNLGKTKSPEKIEQLCLELDKKKQFILNKLGKIHQKKYYFSLYDAIVLYKDEQHQSLKYSYLFTENYLINLDNKYIKSLDLIDEFIRLADTINNYNYNPLKAIKLAELNFMDEDIVISDFSNVLKSFNVFNKSYESFIKLLKFNFSNEKKNILALITAFDLLYNHQLLIETFYEFVENRNDKVNFEIFKLGKLLLEVKNNLKEKFVLEKIRNIDADEIINKLNNSTNKFLLYLNRIKVKSLLKRCLKKKIKITIFELIDYLEEIKKYNEYYNKILELDNTLSKMIGVNILSEIDNLSNLEKAYINTRNFLNQLHIIANEYSISDLYTYFLSLYGDKYSLVYQDFERLFEKYNSYCSKERELTSKYLIDYKFIESTSDSHKRYIDLLEYVNGHYHFDELLTITNINKIFEHLDFIEAGGIVKDLLTNRFDYQDFRLVYETSVCKGIIRLYFKDQDINLFNANQFEEEVNKYRNLIKEYNNLIVASVSAKLTMELTHNEVDYVSSSPIGKLKRMISNNGRGITIRDVLRNYDNIIKKYFPCFLMSPLSAAQYLTVNESDEFKKFDLVIFDEASQIPTHEAIGPIARGNALIVAGDPEQMPPSNYFMSDLKLSDDEVELDDAKSLLDECLSIELPRIRLSYHYRSKYESLINFSNHYFYNDNLNTFPSAILNNSCIEFNYVDVAKEKKNTSLSKEEIKTICDKLKYIYSTPETMNKSVGIIVFNVKQQDILSDAINDMLSQDKKLNESITNATLMNKEPFFIKSLENVQGDERDIIILSIGFRKNSAGKATIVGPLSWENGQRRLNVAVTRSKEKMYVISTIRSSDFLDDYLISTNSSKGHLYLKRFIKYAESCTSTKDSLVSKEQNDIAKYLKKDLESLGYIVDVNVGKSKFKVDLAIYNQDKTEYQLGIILDSYLLGKNISCRDKYFVQENILNSLKWKLINIYTIEYFKNPIATMNKILNALNEPYVKEEINLEPIIEQDFSINKQYRTYFMTKTILDSKLQYSSESGFNSRLLRNAITNIVQNESPVSFNTIIERIKYNSNILVFSPKAKSLIQKEINSLNFPVTHDQIQDFYWNKDSFRLSAFCNSFTRQLLDISKEEILAAMLQVLDIQGDILKEDLYRCTNKVLNTNYLVLNKKAIERFNYVYDWARINNLIKKVRESEN